MKNYKKTGFFNVYVLTLKQEKGNKDIEHKYKIKDYESYRHVNRELACYLINKRGCLMLGMSEKGKPTNPIKGDVIYGYDGYDKRNIIFCITQRIFSFDKSDNDLIFPDINLVSLTPGMTFQYTVNSVIECFESRMRNNEIFDCSIQCSHEWGPKNLIPKGYEWVKEGTVQEGDYVWIIDSYPDRHDYWSKIKNNIYSHERIGKSIEKSGVVFIHKDGSKTRFEYYEPFVIRKK